MAALQLKALAGMAPDAPLVLRGELAPPLTVPERTEALRRALEARPDLEAAPAEAATSAARIRKEQAEGRWDASVNVGYQRQDFGFMLNGPSQVVSEVTVPSPANGIVLTRAVNPGQVVGAGQELFVVTDLSSVWVIGDLYEKDFPSVRVGTAATVAIPSAPNAPLRGRVAYIDPRVEPATRTAKVRVEVPNRGGDLRLGMFVTVSFETGGAQRMTVVPRTAVQSVGERTVVYIPVEGEEGKFVERPVTLGQRGGTWSRCWKGSNLARRW